MKRRFGSGREVWVVIRALMTQKRLSGQSQVQVTSVLLERYAVKLKAVIDELVAEALGNLDL